MAIVAGLTYDIGDEIDTYKRQLAYDGILRFNIELNNEDFTGGKVLNLHNLGKVEIKKMNQITANVVMKISDGIATTALYKTLPRRSLSTSSSVKDIIKSNPHKKGIINAIGLNKFDKDRPYIEFIKVYLSSKPYIYVK